MSGDTNIWKLDNNLNSLIQFNATGTVWYGGPYFNSTNLLLYVPATNLQVIHVFNINHHSAITFQHHHIDHTQSPNITINCI